MTFTTLPFLAFFALVYALLWAIPSDSVRKWILLGASLFFYGYWNAWYILLVLAVIAWSWAIGLFISSSESLMQKKIGVAVGTFLSLLALAVFKYAGFFSENIVWLTGGSVPPFIRDIVLPIGISFYTFHSISYYIDVYRGHVEVARSLREYAIYILFFPQLVAGPIVRASQLLPQLARSVLLTWRDLAAGSRLFLAGAVQKLLLADHVSPFVDKVFANPSLYSGATEWLAVMAYALQIFGDFSGYTLTAIGAARILGYRLPENFRMPYLSTSIVEFWRRWHITLSFFLRDYVYIPLGGNRHGFLMTQRNTIATMLLGGLWHGASWNFVLWGALHGIGIIGHHTWQCLPIRFHEAGPWRYLQSPVGWIITFLFVIMAWIPFRAARFSDTIEILGRIWTFADGVDWFHTPTVITLVGALLWHIGHAIGLRDVLARLASPIWLYAVEIVTMVSLLVLFLPTATSPFIYFQF